MLVRPLAWSTDEVAGEVERRLRSGEGGWSAGVPGGIAEWAADGDEPVVERWGDVVSARTPRGAVRIDCTGLAAFAVSFRVRPDDPRSIVFAAPRNGHQPGPATVEEAGPDTDSLLAEGVGAPLWDMGLGRTACRFLVRTDHPELTEALHATRGGTWIDLVHRAGPLLLEAAPHRIVTTSGARIEVYAPIPPPGGRSPEGPHTHLLAKHLETGRDLPKGVELPDGWTPVATLYP